MKVGRAVLALWVLILFPHSGRAQQQPDPNAMF